MKILGFVHAGVVVEDINKAIEFYNGVLGLEVLDGPGEWVTDFNETRAMGLGDVLHRIAHLKCADGSQVELIEFENSRDLEDSDIKISDIIIEGQTKTLIIETPPVASYCPICGFRMHSRGVKKRTINHPSALLTRDVELQMQLTCSL